MSPDELQKVSHVRALFANGKAREQRVIRRITLQELADAVGASTSTVHRWENGRGMPRGATALRLAEILDLTANVI